MKDILLAIIALVICISLLFWWIYAWNNPEKTERQLVIELFNDDGINIRAGKASGDDK